MAPIKIFVADKEVEPAMEVLNSLGTGEVQLVFASKMSRALASLKNAEYSVIFLGDRVEDGDTYDLGVLINSTKRNRQTPVICIGAHVSKRTKLAGLLKPRSMAVDVSDKDAAQVCADKIRDHLNGHK